MNFFRPLHRERGVTEQQWRVLRALYEVNETDIISLSEQTFLMGPSVSRILPELERRKLITRRTAKADQRRSMIKISAAGRKLIEKHGPKSEQMYAEIERRLGKERLLRLYTMMWELESALGNELPTAETKPQLK